MAKKILYVEDDFFIGDLYKRQLSHSGYEVDIVGNGKAGLEQALAQQYDLVLLDVMLPGMDGVEILRTLKQNDATKQIPVVMLSNLAQDSVMAESEKLGAKGYWVKDQLLPNQLSEQINQIFYTSDMDKEYKQK